MATIVTRAGKGSRLTWTEADANFTNLNTDKIETSAIGVTVQAYDAQLDTWSGVTPGTGVATFLATPSSANLKSAITDETGSGALVFAESPTLVTPTLGVATATSVNKVAVTAPATSATITVADGKTFTASNTITLTGTDSTSYDLDKAVATLTSATSTSGAFSYVDVAIPAGVKEMEINVMSVSYTGTGADDYFVQLGDSGGIEAASYLGACYSTGASASNNSTSFRVTDGITTGTRVISGRISLSLANSSTNTWCSFSVLSNTTGSTNMFIGSGEKSLSGELTTIRFGTIGATNLDGGSISVLYR